MALKFKAWPTQTQRKTKYFKRQNQRENEYLGLRVKRTGFIH